MKNNSDLSNFKAPGQSHIFIYDTKSITNKNTKRPGLLQLGKHFTGCGICDGGLFITLVRLFDMVLLIPMLLLGNGSTGLVWLVSFIG